MAASHSLPITAPANDVAGPRQGCWTYRDYAAIPDDGRRYEIVDGVLYLMPAPNVSHQNTMAALTTYLRIHIDFTRLGKTFPSPIDVRLPPGDSVVQPDVVVVLNQHREMLHDAYILGGPDLVDEVSSPGTATYNRRAKMDLYARAGVPEYWIADPYALALPSRVIPALPAQVQQLFD